MVLTIVEYCLYGLCTLPNCCCQVQGIFIWISLTFQTLFAASFMNNWYLLTKTLTLMMFHCQIVLFLPTPRKSVFFLSWLPFIMPQVTCLAWGACFMNVFELLTLGGVALQDMIVFSFNMILTNQVSVGCMSHGYATFFPLATTRPTFHARWSPGIQLLVPHCAQILECRRSSLILIIWVMSPCQSSISTAWCAAHTSWVLQVLPKSLTT